MLHFWPNIFVFGPFGVMADQKKMQTRCPGNFLLCGYQNFSFLPLNFWLIWSDVQPKNNAYEVPRWFLCYVGTKTFSYSYKKLGFGPKYACVEKFGQVIRGRQVVDLFGEAVQSTITTGD